MSARFPAFRLILMGSALLLGTSPAASTAQSPATAPASMPATTLPASAPTVAATSPATQPATRATTEPVFSLKTPRDTLKSFAAALRDGDADRLSKTILISSPEEQQMIAGMAGMARALTDLHAAARQAFGPEAASRFTDDTAAAFEQAVARIDAAELVINEESATVRYAEAKENPYELKRVDGEWKVLGSQFTHGASAEVLQRRVNELLIQTKIVNELGREITAGKHKTADAAGMAWRSKMMGALGGNPGSKPTSVPAQ